MLDGSGNLYHHAVFGSFSNSSTVRECYLDGYKCGIHVIIQQ